MGGTVKGAGGLVEANVPVGTKAKKLNVRGFLRQSGPEAAQIFLRVPGALGDKGFFPADVHMVKEIAVHKIAVALVVAGRKANVLVKVYAVGLGKIQSLVTTAADQLLINARGLEPVARPRRQSGFSLRTFSIISAAWAHWAA